MILHSVLPQLTKHYNDLVASKKLALITENKLIDINIVGSVSIVIKPQILVGVLGMRYKKSRM